MAKEAVMRTNRLELQSVKEGRRMNVERRRLRWAGVCLPIHGSTAAGLIDHITRG